MAVYYATKAYVLSFTEALHHELKGTGIKVSALCPGPTESEFSDVAESHSPTLERMKMPAAPVVRAGLAGLDAQQGGGHPRLQEQDRRPGQPLPDPRRDAQDHRADQGLSRVRPGNSAGAPIAGVVPGRRRALRSRT